MSTRSRRVARPTRQTIRAIAGRTIAPIVLLAVMPLAIGACATPEQPSPRLVDDIGAVQEYRFHLEPDSGLRVSYDDIEAEGTGAIAVEPPTGWEIRIGWGARPCQRAPIVQVTGTDGQIRAIHVDYGPQLGPGECPDSLVIFGVDLRTSRPLAPDLKVTGSEG